MKEATNNGLVALVPTQVTEIQVGASASRNLRDNAVTASVGEILIGLERQRASLRAQQNELGKAVRAVDEDLAKERVSISANLVQQAEEQYAAPLRTALNGLGFSKKTFEVTVSGGVELESGGAACKPILGDGKNLKATLGIFEVKIQISNGENSYYKVGTSVYGNGTPKFAELKGLRGKLAQSLGALAMEEALVARQIVGMPQVRMQIEAAIAKRDLLDTDDGRAMYEHIKAEFGAMLPEGLKQYMKG